VLSFGSLGAGLFIEKYTTNVLIFILEKKNRSQDTVKKVKQGFGQLVNMKTINNFE
jgi:hypothetical protein